MKLSKVGMALILFGVLCFIPIAVTPAAAQVWAAIAAAWWVVAIVYEMQNTIKAKDREIAELRARVEG